MFGKNPIRPVERHPRKLAVQEIFYTIQGEGPFTGCPAIFIRLAGCNLACTFCDTEFESNIDNVMTLTEVMDRVNHKARQANQPSVPKQLVVLTGGEPMRQSCVALIKSLLDHCVEHVQIETAGTLWEEGLEDLINGGHVSLVCSPKTPKIHPMIYKHCAHYKYIIRAGHVDREDGLPVGGTQANNLSIRQRLFRPWDVATGSTMQTTVWLSPCDEHDEEKNKKNTAAALDAVMFFGYRLSLQTHKMVGLP